MPRKLQHVFGPIPSRRLGQSLGVDTVPLKTCNWNCTYCQLGRSVPIVHERGSYCDPALVLDEVRSVLLAPDAPRVDWVTFVGSGEGTLDIHLGQLIRGVKAMTGTPVAVITNGSLLYMPEVRRDLLAADAVLPTLDAGDEALYRKINRPHPSLDFARYVQGIVDFRAEYRGKLWVEVVLIRGVNDTEEALANLAALMQKIKPDEIHLNLPTRAAAEASVAPSDDEGVQRALRILGPRAAVAPPGRAALDLSRCADVVDQLLGIIARHPMKPVDIEQALAQWPTAQIHTALAELEATGQVRKIDHQGQTFYAPARSHFSTR